MKLCLLLQIVIDKKTCQLKTATMRYKTLSNKYIFNSLANFLTRYFFLLHHFPFSLYDPPALLFYSVLLSLNLSIKQSFKLWSWVGATEKSFK